MLDRIGLKRMSLLTRTVTISDFRKRASKIFDELAQTREPLLIIRHGVAIAVIEDIASYDESQDTLTTLLRNLADSKSTNQGKSRRRIKES